jgi:hypothetical protein
MNNYSKRQAVAADGSIFKGAAAPAPIKALARYAGENATASSVLSLTHDTTAIEIAAVGGTAMMRWVATSDTQASVVGIAGATANFDHIIPTGNVRRFVVPVESMPQTAGSVQGANRENGLFQRVAIKSAGVASVLTTEY